MKHTSGPWVGNTENGVTEILSVADETFGMLIATLEWHSDDETAANEALVAAAPDMMEALEVIMSLAPLNEPIYNLAKNALKKAKGE